MDFLANFLFISSIGVTIFHIIGVNAQTNLVPMPVVVLTWLLFATTQVLGKNGN